MPNPTPGHFGRRRSHGLCFPLCVCGADPKDPITIERLNLMNMAKLSIKGLIESALNLGRTLDSDYAPLQQFFVVMEHCLKHGLKSNLDRARLLSPLRSSGL